MKDKEKLIQIKNWKIKGKNVNAKAHCSRKFVRIENDSYVLLEYAELNGGTFYIIHVYQSYKM